MSALSPTDVIKWHFEIHQYFIPIASKCDGNFPNLKFEDLCYIENLSLLSFVHTILN
jgi:hypothetical protein